MRKPQKETRDGTGFADDHPEWLSDEPQSAIWMYGILLRFPRYGSRGATACAGASGLRQ